MYLFPFCFTCFPFVLHLFCLFSKYFKSVLHVSYQFNICFTCLLSVLNLFYLRHLFYLCHLFYLSHLFPYFFHQRIDWLVPAFLCLDNPPTLQIIRFIIFEPNSFLWLTLPLPEQLSNPANFSQLGIFSPIFSLDWLGIFSQILAQLQSIFVQ